jgi:hypothetical protein
LAALNAAWVAAAMAHTKTRRLILDLDSSESPVHGQPEGAKYNGHYGSVCYHPLFCFNQFGDCEGAVLRAGNVSSAEGWRELLDPIVKRYAKCGLRQQFRGDAGFARPELYEYLEAHDFLYAIRLPANAVLERLIESHLERPATLEPAPPWWAITTCCTRRARGSARVGWSRRSSGTPGSCSRGSVSL